MRTLRFTYWQSGAHWLGYLNEYPDYWTQGESYDDLVDHLRSLLVDLESGEIPAVRRVGEFEVA